MKILVAEDDAISRQVLIGMLKKWNFESIAVTNGLAAWQELQANSAPQLAILDWTMPGMDGIDICKKVRSHPGMASTYIMLLTARHRSEDIVEGLGAGADDYITKPFEGKELQARIQVGIRVLKLQEDLETRVVELQDALSQVKQLRGLLPICSYCKKIRDDQNYWLQIESYFSEYTQTKFSHSICPECFIDKVEPDLGKE